MEKNTEILGYFICKFIGILLCLLVIGLIAKALVLVFDSFLPMILITIFAISMLIVRGEK